jgi:uncharacterized membrane protein YphA (DoxX/SURF4 family)
MSHLPIPLAVLYAGLGGTVLALIVATATNNWSLRVFFLLTLRLAIGWHFLFEGLYKVQSYYAGPTETSRPFTSEPYFKVAPGPLGVKMRKEFSDPEADIAAKVKAPKNIPASEFAQLKAEQQAAECPKVVADLIDAVKGEPEREKKKADEEEAKQLATLQSDQGKEWAKGLAETARKAADKKAEGLNTPAGQDLIVAAKAKYARWVYGVDRRTASIKSMSGDVTLTAPERIEQVEWVKAKAQSVAERQTNGLGGGQGTDAKNVAEWRIAALTAETDLARDADAFIAELQKDLNGGKALIEDAPPPEKRGQLMDRFTMWFLVTVGAFLMGGLFTRVACVLAAGFLVMTYLAHPAFPWYPLPPNTEGNPVFVNKNVIEALALLTLALYPTGRWLGLDAVVLRPLMKYKPEQPVA